MGRRRKKRTQPDPLDGTDKVADDAGSDGKKVPRSFVVKHGKVGKHVTRLVEDLRQVMMPFTALKLKERKKASVKDYMAVASPLGVSHLLVVQQGSRAPNLRIARVPIGPTISFRVKAYALCRQIRTSQKKLFSSSTAFKMAPLVVLNNFDEELLVSKRHLKIASLTFQSMFPSINVRTVKLGDCKRVLLLHLNQEEETIEFRHYLVHTKAAGASRVVKRVLKTGVPDLSRAQDISDILTMRSSNATGCATSDSEFDDDEKIGFDGKIAAASQRKKMSSSQKAKVDKATEAGRSALNQSVVHLYEIGPRMTLQVYKVEEGVCTGEVQYHAFKTKSKEEILHLREEHREKNELRKERREQQEENVKRKREAEKEKQEKKKQKRERLSEVIEQEGEDSGDENESRDDNRGSNNSDSGSGSNSNSSSSSSSGSDDDENDDDDDDNESD